ncbi:CDP-glycerol glycerophosphotransferase family protein [Leuconostoc gasicomitatum]|uniref:CDP-glycerol glycerophosphotransferase family protein n=1 Tax=Leuconostoc gasicomitatum TaxID=115778 RepID=UPI001CC80E95|nr:CDP-glycerol glycerophosphotransferase family protein [Leuconostoc gasicomitatum]MBZ5955500.1 CDP-glycerol glycerophosphotransferase family protein [Leuconostoc gasicomitatum]MBZ5984306.1 CDP-glycerol glycerophosphotransferase family protein [Leuconostoc gasicomitatum]
MSKTSLDKLKYNIQNLSWYLKRYNATKKSVNSFYDNHYDYWPVDDHIVVYDMQDGQELDDSPFAILRYWLSRHLDMQHIIVAKFNTKEKIRRVLQFWQLDFNPNIVVVDYQSIEHMKALLTAKYIVTNAMIFSDVFVKRTGQVFVNTWHGTPLKKMGYAMPGGVMGSWNVIRTLMMTDYLVMPNEYTAEIFRRDYRLDGLYTGSILVTGYPRNDVLINHLPQYQSEFLYSMSLHHKKDRVIIYAPTWSGDTTQITTNREELNNYLSVLKKIGSMQNIQIKFKPHPYFKADVDADTRFDSYRLNDALGTNEILSEADLLITDYSSLFFDFLVTGKPIIFFDTKENYAQERGEYIGVRSLPGPYTKSTDELIKLLEKPKMWIYKYQEVYKQFKKNFTSSDDGHATQRVLELITSKKVTSNLTVMTVLVNGEDFSDTNFSETRLVTRLSKTYDVSIAAFESHLLDNWYGQIFFKHVDAVMPVSRIFINKYNVPYKNIAPQLAQVMGKRVTGGKIFNVLIIIQKKFSRHQQIIISVAKTIIMTKNSKRVACLIKLGFSKSYENERFQIWQKSPSQVQTEVQDILKKIEDISIL